MSVILNAINYFWKLGYNEEVADMYVKKYHDFHSISIDVANEVMNYGDKIRVSDETMAQFSQKNFIILEAVDRFLRKKYRPEDIHIGRSPLYDFAIENHSNQVFIAVQCMEWEEEYDVEVARLKTDHSIVHSFFEKNSDTEHFCAYTSRLKAGTIECRYTVFPRTFCADNTLTYTGGLFEEGIQAYSPEFKAFLEGTNSLSRSVEIIGDFEILNGILMKYTGNDHHVVIPEIVEKMRNSVFWNCSTMEKITIPNTVYSLGGDTFYNCENLSELTIPESVVIMGDNPFANCPKLNLINKSPHFIFEDGGLYDKEMARLIYCAIKRPSDVFEVPNGVISVSKHSFYNCQNLRKIIIPPSVKIMENNPFSNLPDMQLENNSLHFIFRDGALYNKTMTTLFYYEHSTELKNLVIPEGVTIIGRHSFYNCQTIKSITIPSSTKIIGYNPFTNCSSLSLINHSPEYVYENSALYNKEMTELIYCSIPSSVETFVVPDTVKTIGRSAFFSCKNIKKVVIPEGISIIERSAFANCVNLNEVSIPDSVNILGEWAFFNCINLNAITIPKHTSIEGQTFLNCPAKITHKKQRQ